MRWLAWIRLPHAVLSVVVAAAVGALTNLATDGFPIPLVAALIVFVGLQVLLALRERRAQLATARTARLEVLGELEPTVNGELSELDWLSAKFSPTSLWDRGPVVKTLVAWCTSDGPAVRVIDGPPGVGKSRLARAAGENLPAPWFAGWFKKTQDMVSRIRACGDPTLVIVDDADLVPDLADLINQAEAWPPTMRVLLLVRDAQRFLPRLRAEVDPAVRPLLNANPLTLAPVGEASDRERWFAEAAVDYARALRIPPPDTPRLPVGADGDTTLILHARALLAALDRPGVRTLSVSDIAAHLFTLERSQWKTDRPPGNPSDETLTEVVVALTVAPAASDAEAVTILRTLPRLRDTGTERLHDLATWARTRYAPGPDDRLSLRPHLVAEWLYITHLTAHPDVLDALVDHADTAVLTALARACHTFPQAHDLVVHTLENDHDRFTPRLTAVLAAVPISPEVDQALEILILTQAHLEADTIRRALPPGFLRASCACAYLAITRLRELVATDRDVHLGALADALRRYSIQLGHLGRYQQALATIEEALNLSRELVATDRDAHLPALASTLDDYGTWLGDVGRHELALLATEEAVDLWRELAGINGDAHLPRLAGTVANYSIRLSDLGRHQQALTASKEAVDLYRTLVATTDDDTHMSNLAIVLTNYGSRLRDLGRLQQALIATEESLKIRTELVTIDHETRLAHLAGTLGNYGLQLSETGQHEPALTVTEQAVELWRGLTAANRDAYLPDLARTLDSYGIRLGILGRHSHALTASEEALKIRRELVRINREAHLPGLASTLHNYGLRLGDSGRHELALAATKEALEIRRKLVAFNREAYLADFTLTLTNYSAHLSKIRQDQAALAATEEALDLWRELVEIDREAHLAHLAGALRSYSIDLHVANREDEQIQILRECVSTYQECAQKNPDAFTAPYHEVARKLRDLYMTAGDEDAALKVQLDL